MQGRRIRGRIFVLAPRDGLMENNNNPSCDLISYDGKRCLEQDRDRECNGDCFQKRTIFLTIAG
eukprot:8630051-Ditylum_brightwellii.AAC.1